jgi:hypothetical protein
MIRHLNDLNKDESDRLVEMMVQYQAVTIDELQKAFGLCEGCVLRLMIQSLQYRYDSLRQAVVEGQDASKH